MIDVHAHVVLTEVLGAAGPAGPEMGQDAQGNPWYRAGDYVLNGVRYLETPFTDVNLRLNLMAQMGIERQVLSPNPLTYFHGIEASLATNFCRVHNQAMHDLVEAHPEKLMGLGALPMQDIPQAMDELSWIKERGFVGAAIGTWPGCDLHDRALDPFYETVQELDLPLFLHPTPSGIDRPKDRAALPLLLGRCGLGR